MRWVDGDAVCELVQEAIPQDDAYALRTWLEAHRHLFTQDTYKMFGKTVQSPRLVGAFSDKVRTYRYSGQERQARLWPPELVRVKAHVEKHAGVTFNYVLVNLYRDGQDAIGWHSDNETAMNKGQPIASVSLGDSRAFEIRRHDRDIHHKFILHDRSLFLMKGDMQQRYQHRIKKEKNKHVRWNLTFRVLET